VKFLGARKPKP